MKRLARYVLAAMLAGTTVLPAMPASAEDYDGDDYRDSAPDPDDYHDALTPHGRWIDHAEHGRVWHPSVALGWRPYYYGHWAWSPYGWTWISSEPWGWTFHYGRWSYAPLWGWLWVPGTLWGPAWVDWYWDDGYVGWAPLSPYASHVTVVNHFVFVREHDFCSPHGRIFDHRRLPRRVHDHWRQRERHDRGFGRSFRPPDRNRIERAAGRPIPRFDGKPPQTVAPRRPSGGDRLARPRTTPDLGQARRGGWARGDRRADDAPDARPRAGRERDGLDMRARPGRNPGVTRREPRISPPDPAPRFYAPDADTPRRRQGDERVARSRQRPYPEPERLPSGARQSEGYRRPAPPAIPGGSMMVPQSGGQPRERGVARSGGTEASIGRPSGALERGARGTFGGAERGGRGDWAGHGDGAGRGNAGGRGDGFGRGFQAGAR